MATRVFTVGATLRPGPVLSLDHTHHIQFPISAIKHQSFLEHSDLSTFCSWKGYASYWNVVVDGKQIRTLAATSRFETDTAL